MATEILNNSFADLAAAYNLTPDAIMLLKQHAGSWPDDIDDEAAREVWSIFCADHSVSQRDDVIAVVVERIRRNIGAGPSDLAVAAFPLTNGQLVVIQRREPDAPDLTVRGRIARHITECISRGDHETAERWIGIATRLHAPLGHLRNETIVEVLDLR